MKKEDPKTVRVQGLIFKLQHSWGPGDVRYARKGISLYLRRKRWSAASSRWEQTKYFPTPEEALETLLEKIAKTTEAKVKKLWRQAFEDFHPLKSERSKVCEHCGGPFSKDSYGTHTLVDKHGLRTYRFCSRSCLDWHLPRTPRFQTYSDSNEP